VPASHAAVGLHDSVGAPLRTDPPLQPSRATADEPAAHRDDPGNPRTHPRSQQRFTFDASALICTGGPSDPLTCLTPQEADAVSKMGDGPRDPERSAAVGGPAWEAGSARTPGTGLSMGLEHHPEVLQNPGTRRLAGSWGPALRLWRSDERSFSLFLALRAT
jgi:hypothetical protein